ncbi:secreted RxLR effector protein 161-like [Humulus lupulus]|uniref:secreted RxLR effector protein 161-like n=1 Tax=Humulus lupulus TaxID=3486 RepID=UPI002B415D0C|nr:secreted RxLR effector protein 161-like [Humulus lupulus]
MAQLEYASTIWSLIYVVHCTRADIAFAISKLSRFTSNPSIKHWKVVERIFGYLKMPIYYASNNLCVPKILEGYSDTSWISGVEDNLSIIGWVFTLGGDVVSWGSKKKTYIIHSTMDFKFVALIAIGKEVEWLRDLMLEIPKTVVDVSRILIHCDNQATFIGAYNKIYNGKSRHISLRHDYVR